MKRQDRKKLLAGEPIYLLWENGQPIDTGTLTAYKSLASAKCQRTNILHYQSKRTIDIIPYYPSGEQPLYKNSPDTCDRCVFLGLYEGHTDLYYCPQTGNLPTVMAICSEEPGDYISGLRSKDSYPPLKKAYEIAKERGLIK